MNHSDPAAAAKEIHRCDPDQRFVHVLMASGSSRLLARRFLYPLYAAAAEHGLPIANYPDTAGSGTSGDPTPADRPTRNFEWQKIIHQNF